MENLTGQQNDQQNPNAGQQQDGDNGQTPISQEKVYAGRFKTPEELEEAYKLSSNEGVRLAHELKRLQSELNQARTPKQAEVIQDKIDDLAKYFDPETARVLNGYFDNRLKSEISKALSERDSQADFQKQVSDSWQETVKLYPEVANQSSKLYQRANQLLFERGLAEVDANGTLKLLSPFSYRIAVEAALAEVGRQAPENAQTQVKKNQATSIQGRASKTVPSGKLTYEQYMKLSDDEKDVYDKQQIGK